MVSVADAAPPARSIDPSERAGTSLAAYNFHGLFSLNVGHRGLRALLEREFAMFRAETDEADLTVAEGPVAVPGLGLFPHYHYDDAEFVVSAPEGNVRVEASRLCADPAVPPEHLLSAWVENVMKRQVIARGAAFVHASAVSRGGSALLFPAWMHTGKTDVAINFLEHGYDYLGDDWCFVSRSGDVLGYPRWLHLFRYHFEAHPSLRAALAGDGRSAALARRLAVHDFVDSLGTSNPLVRRIGRWLADRFYVAETVPVEAVVPGARVALHAPLRTVCLLHSSDTRTIRLTESTPEELARKTVMCGDYERRDFPWHLSAMAYAGLPVNGPYPAPEEIDLLSDAFRGARCLQMTMPASPRPEDLDRIRGMLEEA